MFGRQVRTGCLVVALVYHGGVTGFSTIIGLPCELGFLVVVGLLVVGVVVVFLVVGIVVVFLVVGIVVVFLVVGIVVVFLVVGIVVVGAAVVGFVVVEGFGGCG